MLGRRFLYRLVGVLWIAVGVALAGTALAYLVAASLIDHFFLTQLPELSALLGPVLRVQVPFAQQIAGLLFGAYCIVFGLGLMNLHSWTRTIGVAFHIGMGAALAVLAYMFFTRAENALPQDAGAAALVLSLIPFVIALCLIAFGLHLAQPASQDAFFGFLPMPQSVQSPKCPHCDSALDLQAARCPSCDKVVDAQSLPKMARLIDEANERQYTVVTRRHTRIGRDMPGYEVQLDDTSVSGEHAIIEYEDGRFYLHAQKDTNGTYVNDMEHRVRDAELADNDVVAFGRVQLKFKIEY